ncbi:retrovirus-related pol polyprotein from transposon TNT 1-94 [Tanacetum coccineum]
MQQSFIHEYNENLMLKAELANKQENIVENKFFNEVVLRCSRLENRSANLELKLQHQKESFLNNNPLNNQNAPEIQEFFHINEWQAKLDVKDVSIAKLKIHIENLKGKNVVEKDATPNNAKVIAPEMFKLDLEPLSPKVLKNRDARIDYIKHTQENADILWELVEHARELRPLDSDLDSACKYAKRIQEVLVYVTATCPSLTKPCKKLLAVTPMNKNKKVRFFEPVASSRMKSSTSSSRSQPSGNTKKNRISRTTSSNQQNNVEEHPRSVKSSSNKMNRVIEHVCNAKVKHSMINTNSELICATCNECMFDTIHDLCVLDFVNDVNVRSKSKSSKGSKKKTTWKPTGKVFTNVGYKWIPTGRKFTINGNRCPLTRITSTNVVPPKNPLTTKVAKKTTRRNNIEMLKDVVQIVLWYLNSGCSKHMNGNRFQGKARNTPTNPKLRTPFKKALFAAYGPLQTNEDSKSQWTEIHIDNGTEFVNQTLKAYYEDVRISHQTHVAQSLQQNGIEEVVAITCYIQNRSLIRKRQNNTLYELLHDKKPDLSYLHVFGALCYPTNDSEDLGKLKPKEDIGIFFRPGPQLLTPGTISSGLVSNPPSPTPVAFLVLVVVAPEPADPTSTSSSTSIDQDAPSPIAHLDSDPFFGVPIPEPNSGESSLGDVIPTNWFSILNKAAVCSLFWQRFDNISQRFNILNNAVVCSLLWQRPNGDALRKCILEGPYTPFTITIPAIPAIDDSLEVPERTAVETILNMSPENKAYYESEKEAIHLLLTGIGDEIYSIFDACKTAHEMLIAKNANPLALVAAAQQYPDSYYQAPKSHKTYAPTSKQSSSTRSNASSKYKGKEIAKPITPPSESSSKEDSDPEQA